MGSFDSGTVSQCAWSLLTTIASLSTSVSEYGPESCSTKVLVQGVGTVYLQ